MLSKLFYFDIKEIFYYSFACQIQEGEGVRKISALLPFFSCISGSAMESSACTQPPQPKFENTCCSSITAETTLSYLFWSAREDNLYYAVENAFSFVPLVPDVSPDGKFRAPKERWDSGFRVEVATAIESQSFKQYGFRAFWTFFELDSSASSRTSNGALGPLALANTTLSLLPNSPAGPFLVSLEAKGKWNLQMNQFALNLEYFWQTAPCILFRPYVGAFGAMIHQKLNTAYTNAQVNGILRDLKNSSESRYWGVGPSVGFGMDWAFTSFFHLIGSVYASGLYGLMNLKSSPTVPTAVLSLFPHNISSAYCLRTVTGMQLGAELKRSLTQCTTIAFSASYECQYWPRQWKMISNQVGNFFLADSGWGDLSVQGLVTSAKIAF